MNKNKNFKKIVYSPIVADLFHYGHLQSLKFAKSQGDYLICGVLTDNAALYYKKNLVSDFNERKSIISNLSFIDEIINQNDKDPTENLKKIHKKFKDSKLILVHGDDWRTIPGEEFINKIGGQIIKHPYYTKLSDFKITKTLLERYKDQFKMPQELKKYFEAKDFTYYNPRKLKGGFFQSKADTLRHLLPVLKNSVIEDTFVFIVLDWKEEKYDIIKTIKEKFYPSKIVVRSSSIVEDAKESSMAGYFHSELNVSTTENEIEAAINNVVNSYNKKNSNLLINQVLVQRYTENVAVSGVIFTRDAGKNAPYYIINYDDKTGSTDSVTKGIEGKSIKILRFCNENKYPEQFKKLMISVKEIEAIAPKIGLDIEFAINNFGQVVVFQVRPLITDTNKNMDEIIRLKVKQLKNQFETLSKKKSHIAGLKNCFGDMPDWNPAEIIGDNPNYLDYSLYDYIITDNVWHKARSSQGYYDVGPAKLVVLFANKPYVDIRNTFNSFIPKNIDANIKEKLMEFYIEKLKKNPELQDKVEFDILYTCYDLSFDKRSKELLDFGFSKDEVNQLRKCLLELTNNLIINSKKSVDHDMKNVLKMNELRNEIRKTLNSSKNHDILLKSAKKLLDDCKTNGTLQFSRLARLAFIGNIILKSMVSENIVDEDFYDSFMNSIQTVAKQMNSDFNLFALNRMGKNGFLKLYGHLRPGTYDITSQRYDKNRLLFENLKSLKALKDHNKPFSIDNTTQKKISKELKNHSLEINSHDLFDFIKLSIESRELSKFEFTKSLSDAIELIAQAGKILKFSTQQMSQLGVDDLFESGDEASIKKKWESKINERLQNRKINDQLILPPLIFSEDDFDVITYYSPRPNFITQKKIEAECIDISDKKENPTRLKGRIVLLESGDPGFDWIFTKSPAGLITKYGGIASHMSIRAAEFGLPAAIGCGEIFDKLRTCNYLTLDCKSKKIIYD